jgi:hypothetical protein
VTRSKKAPPPGEALELEVLNLLRGAGFRAHRNSRTAKPRQTDILAQGNDLTLLVEVKDRKRVVDVSDIDGLRARLGRTTPDVIGMIVTTSSISQPAIKEIESDRTREILVFVSSEIELLRKSKARLLNLINKKRGELRLNGRVWFRKGVGGEYLGVELPRSTMEFVANQDASTYFCSRTEFAHAALSMEIPDTGWSISGGDGIRLLLSLSLSTIDELQDLFRYLHDSFGLSSNGAFSIHQEGASWHGIGVRNLLAIATDPWSRYRAASMERVHHSEDIVYFDQFRNGWFTLYTRQRVPEGRSRSYLHETDVCIQLPGVPVDASPYLDLCRYTGNEWADFRTVHGRRKYTSRLKKPLKLEVVGTLVRTDDDREKERWVVGLVVRNPFYRKKKLPREFEIEGSPLHELLEMELILCDLKDHLEEGDQVDQYVLQGIETTDAQYVQVIRPFGTWNAMVKRRHGQSVHEVAPDGVWMATERMSRVKRLNLPRLRRSGATRK